jgi:hypothetical protein
MIRLCSETHSQSPANNELTNDNSLCPLRSCMAGKRNRARSTEPEPFELSWGSAVATAETERLVTLSYIAEAETQVEHSGESGASSAG